MSLKDAYIDKLKAQLDEWSADIDHLEATARKADADLRIKYESQLVTLRAKRDEAQVKLAEIHASVGDAWQELKKGSDEAWDAIKRALIDARKKFGD